MLILDASPLGNACANRAFA